MTNATDCTCDYSVGGPHATNPRPDCPQHGNIYGDENFSHPVKATEVEIHYTDSAQATIHKAGCQHAAYEKRPLDISTVQADDYFNVAPCARRKG